MDNSIPEEKDNHGNRKLTLTVSNIIFYVLRLKRTKTLSVKGKINYQETEGEKVATRTVLSSVFVGFREPRAGFGWVAWQTGRLLQELCLL